MKKVAIIYWSGTGNTAAMAELVAQGVQAAGGEAQVFACDSFAPDQLGNFDHFAFGCPSMGAEQLEETEFEPLFHSLLPSLKDKTCALFGSYGWGNGEWMEDWAALCREHGLYLVQDGIICQGAPEGDVAAELQSMGRALA